jgi:hypothetical protein
VLDPGGLELEFRAERSGGDEVSIVDELFGSLSLVLVGPEYIGRVD